MLIHLSLSRSVSLDCIALCRGYVQRGHLSPYFVYPSIYPSIYPSTYAPISPCAAEQTQIHSNKADGWDKLHV